MFISGFLLMLTAAVSVSCSHNSDDSFNRELLGKIIKIEGSFDTDVKSSDFFFEVSSLNGKKLNKPELISLSMEVSKTWRKDIKMDQLDKRKKYIIEGFLSGGYRGLPEGTKKHLNVPDYINDEFSFRQWFEVLSISEK